VCSYYYCWRLWTVRDACACFGRITATHLHRQSRDALYTTRELCRDSWVPLLLLLLVQICNAHTLCTACVNSVMFAWSPCIRFVTRDTKQRPACVYHRCQSVKVETSAQRPNNTCEVDKDRAMEVLIMCINGGRGMKVTLNTNKHHVITKSSTAQNAIHSCCYSYHYLTHISYDVLHSSSLNSSERHCSCYCCTCCC
jgi:hypothetical protein